MLKKYPRMYKPQIARHFGLPRTTVNDIRQGATETSAQPTSTVIQGYNGQKSIYFTKTIGWKYDVYT